MVSACCVATVSPLRSNMRLLSCSSCALSSPWFVAAVPFRVVMSPMLVAHLAYSRLLCTLLMLCGCESSLHFSSSSCSLLPRCCLLLCVSFAICNYLVQMYYFLLMLFTYSLLKLQCLLLLQELWKPLHAKRYNVCLSRVLQFKIAGFDAQNGVVERRSFVNNSPSSHKLKCCIIGCDSYNPLASQLSPTSASSLFVVWHNSMRVVSTIPSLTTHFLNQTT